MPPPDPPDFAASQLFLRRLAYSLVRDPARADDLVQDTWAAWVERRPANVAEPRAWLARVLRNHAFNLKRSESRRSRREALAGRPDPASPETDGTLEAQEQLLASLRALDEPYRSTLVQRYYHDLSPREIAERSGAPLDTVKSRLARGLERLRAAMDARYRGDRGAWCHWLASLAHPPLAPLPPASHAPPSAAAAAGAASASSALTWVAALASVAAIVTWRAVSTRAPDVEPSPPSRVESAPRPRRDVARRPEPAPPAERPRPTHGIESPGRPAPDEKPGLALSAAWLNPEVGAPLAGAERETFEWPQFAGSARHDNWREREDEVLMPAVQWFLPGLVGAPTLADGELYSGGYALLRVDPVGGWVLTAPDVTELLTTVLEECGIESGEDVEPRQMERFQNRVAALAAGGAKAVTIAEAPVLAPGRVLARRTRDGGVSAYRRPSDLMTRMWSWAPPPTPRFRSDPGDRRVPLCLADGGVVLVAFRETLFALSIADGLVRWSWSFDELELIHMVPAAADGRVFVGSKRGTLVALDLETGEEQWRTTMGWLGTSSPVIVGERMLCVDPDSRPVDYRGGNAHLLRCDTGARVWRSEIADFVGLPGLGPDASYAVLGRGDEIARVALADGSADGTKATRTARNPCITPTVVGTSLVFGARDGALHVHDLESGARRWSFRPPERAEVQAFVHSGKRIYVATSAGLFCLADDPRQAPPAAGYVLEWNGDLAKPFHRAPADAR